MELKKNEIVTIEIDGYTAEGSGVGRARGAVVFVPGAARGDRLRARIVKAARNHAYGKIEEILLPSPHRVDAACGCFQQCGGCAFRHLSYEEELWAKERRVRDAVERIGGLADLPVRPIVRSERITGYRNKAQMPLGLQNGALVTGFYAPRSHRIVACPRCALQPESFSLAIGAFRAWFAQSGESVYDESTGTGRLRHLYLRAAEATGEVMACVVANGGRLRGEDLLVRLLRERVPGLRGVLINSNRARTNVILGEQTRVVWGDDHITDELCGLRFSISPHAFYQVNRAQAERLYGVAREYAAPAGGLLLDLYCGTGTIGLSMAEAFERLIGVELVEPAVRDARKNAARNGIANAEFLCADAAKAAAVLRERGERPRAVVLDPPRKGCAPELLHTVASLSPARIVYVSCDPATLARDLRLLRALGYRAAELTPVDMFPRTAHVECAVLVMKEKSSYGER